jgi:hypothetical protein
MEELRALEFEAKMKGVTKKSLGPIGRPAIPVQMKDAAHTIAHAITAGACVPANTIKNGLCMGGNTVKVPGSGSGQMLPSDCAKLCEADTVGTHATSI